ncbi:SDR family NAD(P)-dependent oxidoreductase [Psychromonas ossibalaenae]|uniref:SDR family NAD(P)-dependent oxidoreductase n=1 Tax=Psychromonas ossibalaenae TaxID=444922 RepID=UPI000380A308|nr:SDR family oxidoreductase [Psychromonas ossibalaenae]
MIDPKLKGKVVLITGANNFYGIGAAVAKAFARQGAKVLLTYLRLSPEEFGIAQLDAAQAAEAGLHFYHARRAEGGADIVNSIKDEGGWVEAFEADLTDPEQLLQLFDWGERNAGPIDILINNAAAYQELDTIFTASLSTYRKTFDVNVGGTLSMMVEFVRRFEEQGRKGGCIINLSTDSAQAFSGQINYGASKAAIEAFTRSVAIETGPLGIRVNAIAPGPTQSGYISAESEQELSERIPLQRIGEPEDIADAAVFFASDQARWITGEVIKVSGGHTL